MLPENDGRVLRDGGDETLGSGDTEPRRAELPDADIDGNIDDVPNRAGLLDADVDGNIEGDTRPVRVASGEGECTAV